MKTNLDLSWAEARKLYAEARKLGAEASKLRAEARKLRTEAEKLWAEADKLNAEARKLYAEAEKLWAEARKLWAEADKLNAEARKLWADAVARECGPDASIEWVDTGCIVLGVMEFLYEGENHEQYQEPVAVRVAQHIMLGGAQTGQKS